VATLKGHNSSVSVLKLNKDEHRCVSASWDKTAKIWDLNTGATLANLEYHKSPVTSLFSVGSQDQVLLSTSFDGVSVLWDARSSLKPLRIFDPAGYKIPPWCLSVTFKFSRLFYLVLQQSRRHFFLLRAKK
jgi:WD40 repeat protein